MSLTDHTGNTHGARIALRKVQALMFEYEVVPGDLALSAVRAETCRNIQGHTPTIPGWLNALVSVVCMAAGCRSYYGCYQQSDKKKRRCVTFYGFGERPAVAAYLFDRVCQQLKRDANQYLHTTCAHPLLKLSTVRNCMDKYRLHWVAGVWSVLESFEPSPDEKTVLERWLSQQQLALVSARERQPGECRNVRKMRQAGWGTGSLAGIDPVMATDNTTDWQEEKDELLIIAGR